MLEIMCDRHSCRSRSTEFMSVRDEIKELIAGFMGDVK
jgi:hypothetical protein